MNIPVLPARGSHLSRSAAVSVFCAAALAVVIGHARAQEEPAPEPRTVTMPEMMTLLGSRERLRITGILLCETAPGRVYLRTDTGKLRAQISTPIAMKPGDRLALTGFPIRFNQTPGLPRLADDPVIPWLNESTAVNLGPAGLPQAVPVAAAGIYTTAARRAELDGEFVRMKGRVTGFSDFSNEYTVNGKPFILELDAVEFDDEGRHFQALFEPSAGVRTALIPGSLLEITGTCRLEPRTPADRPGIIQVMVPGLAQATVLELPPFWSRPLVQHNARIAGVALAAVIVLGTVWAIGKWRKERLLRRLNAGLEKRVADRTAELEHARADLERALAAERHLSDLKSNFVSMVSHEFRTPLGIIGSSAQILNRYDGRLADDDRREHLGAIDSGVKRMAGMMEDVLVLSRVDSGRMEFKPVLLAPGDLFRRLNDEFASASGTAAELAIEPDAEAPARADENLLRHIVTNLLSNARKYSPPGSPVRLTLARRGTDAVVTIGDEGLGIPGADQPHLFEAFHRGSNVGHVSGTGLGLVIVRRCCEIQGGSVSVASREGEGTTFTVRLPLWTGVDG